MRSCLTYRWLPVLLGLASLLALLPAQAQPLAVVGILEGGAVLVRQTARHALAEGAALNEGDIVETLADAFMQIEYADGALVGLGGATKLIVRPRLTRLKTLGSPRLYLLAGWLKVDRPAGKAQGAFSVLSPLFELNAVDGTTVARVQPRAYAVFAENGSASLVPRNGPAIALRAGDYAAQTPAADKPVVQPRLDPDFVQHLPRHFRDRLPARAQLFEKRTVTLKSLGQVSYADVRDWMRSEPGVRLALSRQWRARAADRDFRTEVDSNLQSHLEWEPVLYPERFLPKPPPPPPQLAPRPAVAPSAPTYPKQ